MILIVLSWSSHLYHKSLLTAKSVSFYSAGRRHNLDSDLRDKLGRQFSPERRPSLDRSGRRVQRFNGKICSFGLGLITKNLSTSRSGFLSSDYNRWNSKLQDMKTPGHLRSDGMPSSLLGSAAVICWFLHDLKLWLLSFIITEMKTTGRTADMMIDVIMLLVV